MNYENYKAQRNYVKNIMISDKDCADIFLNLE